MTASSVHDARQENHYYNYHNTEQEQQQNLIEVSKNWNLHRTGKSTTNGRHFDSMNNSNMTTTSTMSSSSSVMQSSTTTLVQTTTLITNYHSADNTNNPLSNLYKSLSTLRLYSYILSVLSLLLSSSSVCVSSTKFKCSLRNTNKQPSSSISNNKTTGLVTGKVTLFVCAILSAIWLIESIDLATQMPKLDNFVGFTSPQFAAVEKIFRRNFEEGWEREGAALAVYYKGELVVDLQAGYADASAHRAWTPQTRTVVFSATKAVGALCVALLVDRGELRYSDFVSKYWPEFAQNGKENITVDWIMSHRAGLAALDEPISRADAFNPKRIADIIARQKPNWTPGTKSGYHAITYGWLVDQLIRRADPKRRGIGQFFREEIAQPHDIDFHIGLPAEEEHTMSRISLPSNVHLLKEIVYDPRILIMLAILYIRPPNSIAWRVRANPHWLKLQNDMNTFNDPELHQMEQAAALGITKAKDLGKLFALFQQGKIVSRELLEQFRRPQISEGLDAVILAPMAKGHGFLYEKHPYKRGRWLVGHPGYGGSSVMMDMENDLVIAYVSNGLKTGMGELTRTYRLLRNAVLSAL